jgi:hypothetical protein
MRARNTQNISVGSQDCLFLKTESDRGIDPSLGKDADRTSRSMDHANFRGKQLQKTESVKGMGMTSTKLHNPDRRLGKPLCHGS